LAILAALDLNLAANLGLRKSALCLLYLYHCSLQQQADDPFRFGLLEFEDGGQLLVEIIFGQQKA